MDLVFIRVTIKNGQMLSKDSSPPANRYILGDRKGDFHHDTIHHAGLFLAQKDCPYETLTTISCTYFPQK